MRIVLFNWKDIKHPLAGGAEVLTHHIAKRAVEEGHEIIWISAFFKNAKKEEVIDGYKVIRMGNKLTLYPKAMIYYLKKLKDKTDLVIDEINTLPFMAKFYAGKKNIIFIHQLAREIWFYEMPKFIGWIGYLLEPLYLRLLNNVKTITVSNSTKQDLIKYGFKKDNVFIVSEGTEIEPVENLNIDKYKDPTLLILGSVRSMKRTLEAIQAFEKAKEFIPELKLKLAGSMNNSYGKKVHNHILNSPFKSDIEVLGKVSFEEKKELMQKCHLLLVTSVKEGWCLVVTEANSQGTPAVVYNVDGLRDSVENQVTGIVTSQNPYEMAQEVSEVLSNPELYNKLRINAWNKSKLITFDKAYADFKLAADIK